jgi:hypothetical protein
MPHCFSIVEDRDGQPSRVLVEVDDCAEAETLLNDLRLRRHRVYLVRGQLRTAGTARRSFGPEADGRAR